MILTWGNSEVIVERTETIGRREGIGDMLAEGSQRAAERIGGNAKDFLATVKGLESPMHGPRASHGYSLAYAVSPRGACHMASLDYPIEGGMMYFLEYAEVQRVSIIKKCMSLEIQLRWAALPKPCMQASTQHGRLRVLTWVKNS